MTLLSALVNYRGSLGFGQDNIASLPGNVGSQDVQDVQVQATRLSTTMQPAPLRSWGHNSEILPATLWAITVILCLGKSSV